MEKLNTLKDFLDRQLVCDDCSGIHHNILKEEAIKWIHKLEKDANSNYDDTEYSVDGYTCNVINWIKHFFNIDESKLK